RGELTFPQTVPLIVPDSERLIDGQLLDVPRGDGRLTTEGGLYLFTLRRSSQ
ncbi:hypothetical protein A2U01_0099169, partial [Trifolium medium]|nr:hypothetical protein [Trifolium medium]